MSLMRSAPLFLLAASAFSQTPADPPLFHTGAKEALVETVVTDKMGAFESGLSRSDFHVFEDGKERPIVSFALESNETAAARHPHFIALAVEAEQPGLHDQLLDFVDSKFYGELLQRYARARG